MSANCIWRKVCCLLDVGTDRLELSFMRVVWSTAHSLLLTQLLRLSTSMRTGCSPAHRAPRFELSTLTRATPKSTKVTNPGSIAWRHTMSTTTKESKSVPGSCPDPMTLLFAFGICTHAKGLRSYQSIRTVLLAWRLQLVILHPIVCTHAARITSRSSGI